MRARSSARERATDWAGSPETSDPVLQAGSPAALDLGEPRYARLEQACAAEFPRLVRLLTLYCGDRETALDLAQETLARGCVNWQRVAVMDDQSAWFTRVALNLANSRWRRLRVERRVLTDLGRPAAHVEQVDVETAISVRGALAALTRRQRSAVVLRYFADLDLAATATVMGCSPGTVKKLTARALSRLREQLDVDLPEAHR